ncbi:MAG: lytic murein transglycosylase [Alphaproteobacteria bacterium]
MTRSSFSRFIYICGIVVFGASFALNNNALAEESFSTWVHKLWPEAQRAGVSKPTFDRIFARMTVNCHQPDVSCGKSRQPRVPLSDHTGLPATCNKVAQKEFLQPDKYFPPAYLRRLALRGREILRELKSKDRPVYRSITDVERNFRVSRLVLMGIWGRETAFGEAPLDYNAVQALASSAYAGIKSRRAFARRQLLAALVMIERGEVTYANFRASYAGATGLTQIMPHEYLKFAVDADLDGRKDVWRSVADSMATTANILKDRGWQSSDRSWGYEVVSRGKMLNCTLEGPKNRWPIRRWMKEHGLKRVPRNDIEQPRFPNPANDAYLLAPAGTRGPAFLVTGNFDVLRRYNPSELYALFVGHCRSR